MNPELELWQAVAFCSPQALGNPTGIVFSDQPLAPASCQTIAAKLGLSDTAFLSPGQSPTAWRARFYSPAEELSACFQAFLAAAVVIWARNPALASSDLDFESASGRIRVLPGEQGLSWICVSRSDIQSFDATQPLPVAGVRVGAERVISVNCRKRQFVRLASRETLSKVRLEPEEVLGICASHSVNGLCFFVVEGHKVALRVFTTSLDGREDASTGGAVAGLVEYLKHERAIAEEPGGRTSHERSVWEVEQGQGPLRRRGALLGRELEDGSGVAVGGRCEITARGVWMGSR